MIVKYLLPLLLLTGFFAEGKTLYTSKISKHLKGMQKFLHKWRGAMVQWLRQKTHDGEVLGSHLHNGDHFSGTIHLDQSMELKQWKTQTWHYHMCCNPANGCVDFEEQLAYKIQLNGKRLNCKLVSRLRPKSKKKTYTLVLFLN